MSKYGLEKFYFHALLGMYLPYLKSCSQIDPEKMTIIIF